MSIQYTQQYGDNYITQKESCISNNDYRIPFILNSRKCKLIFSGSKSVVTWAARVSHGLLNLSIYIQNKSYHYFKPMNFGIIFLLNCINWSHSAPQWSLETKCCSRVSLPLKRLMPSFSPSITGLRRCLEQSSNPMPSQFLLSPHTIPCKIPLGSSENWTHAPPCFRVEVHYLKNQFASIGEFGHIVDKAFWELIPYPRSELKPGN